MDTSTQKTSWQMICAFLGPLLLWSGIATFRGIAKTGDTLALGDWLVCTPVTFLGAGLLYFTAQELSYPDWARFALPAVAMVAAAVVMWTQWTSFLMLLAFMVPLLVMFYMLFKSQQHR